MHSVYHAALRSWSVPPTATFALILTAVVYLRGWGQLRRSGVPFVPTWRAGTFLLGLFSVWAALASPLDTFSGFLLTAHMLQHMLLMMVAPPLILLGVPLIPIVRGLPIFAAREFAGPFLKWRLAQQVGRALTNPIFGLLLMGVVTFGWHAPGPYGLALRSSSWHQVEHACFFLASLLFWWPVIQPWPSRSRWPRWGMVPYLLIADLQNTILSAILVFSDRVLYPWYSTMPRLFGLSAQQDQAAAGAIMWVVGSLAFVVPAIVIAVQSLSQKPSQRHVVTARPCEPRLDQELAALALRIPSVRPITPLPTHNARLQVISFVVLFVAGGLALAGLASFSNIDDDNQALRFQAQSGPFELSVFAQVGDLPAGSSDFNILLQDHATHDVLLDATVDVTAYRSDGAAVPSRTRAASEDSENKLLQTVQMNLPSQGDWTMSLLVHRDAQEAQFQMPLHVIASGADSVAVWPFVVFGAIGVLLSIAYLWRHHRHKASTLEHAVPSQQSSLVG